MDAAAAMGVATKGRQPAAGPAVARQAPLEGATFGAPSAAARPSVPAHNADSAGAPATRGAEGSTGNRLATAGVRPAAARA